MINSEQKPTPAGVIEETPLEQKRIPFQKVMRLALLGFLGLSATTAAIGVRMFNDPNQRGRVVHTAEQGLKILLGDERGRVARQILDDWDEQKHGLGNGPGSIRHILSGSYSDYEEEKTERDRKTESEAVIKKHFSKIVVFRDGYRDEDPQREAELNAERAELHSEIQKVADKLSAEYQSKNSERYRDHHELVEELITALSIYNFMVNSEGSISEKLNQEMVKQAVFEIIDLVIEIIYQDDGLDATKLGKIDNLDDLVGNGANELISFLITAKQIRVSQHQVSTLVLGGLRSFTEQALDGGLFYIEPLEDHYLTVFEGYTEGYWKVDALAEADLTDEQVIFLVKSRRTSPKEVENYKTLLQMDPNLSNGEIFEMMFDIDVLNTVPVQDILLYYRNTQLAFRQYNQRDLPYSEVSPYLVATMKSVGNIDENRLLLLNEFPPLDVGETLDFIARENLTVEQFSYLYAFKMNLSIYRHQEVTWDEVMKYVDEGMQKLSLNADGFQLFLIMLNYFPPGNNGDEKIIALYTPFFNEAELIFSEASKNQITFDEFMNGAQEFLDQNQEKFGSSKRTLLFFAGSMTNDTRGAKADLPAVTQKINFMLELFGESIFNFPSENYPDTGTLEAWKSVLSELDSGGLRISSLLELDQLFSPEDYPTIRIEDVRFKVIPLGNEAVQGDTAGEEKYTQLPLVYFSMGESHPLSTLIKKGESDIKVINEEIPASDFDRNLWIFDENGMEIIPMRSLGNTTADVLSSLQNRSGFITALVPSTLVWREGETDPGLVYSRTLNAAIGYNQNLLVAYRDITGKTSVAAIHIEGYGPEFFDDDKEHFAFMDQFLSSIRDTTGEIIEIVPLDPGVSALFSVSTGGTSGGVVSYSFNQPLPSSFTGSLDGNRLFLQPN